MLIDVDQILEMHEFVVNRWHHHGIHNPYAGFLHIACRECALNYRLWHQEDVAHGRNVSDRELADAKRTIDKLNRLRNSHIELMDDWIAEALERRGVITSQRLPLNTETPGSVIDRLSILALRVFHLEEQLHRDDTDAMYRRSVLARRNCCFQQRTDLVWSLKHLIRDITLGRKRHKTYRQYRIYNAALLDFHCHGRRAAA
ncbi:MAG: DUF4254 domain-containing protein [Planctomycetota bacterium]